MSAPDPVKELTTLLSAMQDYGAPRFEPKLRQWLDRWGPFIRAAMSYFDYYERTSGWRSGCPEFIAMLDSYRKAVSHE